jgi:hypothetical protein
VLFDRGEEVLVVVAHLGQEGVVRLGGGAEVASTDVTRGNRWPVAQSPWTRRNRLATLVAKALSDALDDVKAAAVETIVRHRVAVGRASNRKAAARALRPPADIASLVAALRDWEARLDAQVPGWWRDMDALRLARPAPWPQWCLVPMAAAYAVVERAGWLGGHSFEPSLISAVAACYAWQQGRGVYVFEPELAEALLGR